MLSRDLFEAMRNGIDEADLQETSSDRWHFVNWTWCMSFHVLPLTCIICINLIFTYVQGMWLGRRSTTSCCVAYKMSPSFEARWSRSWRKSRRLVGMLFTRSLCLYWLIWLFLTFSAIFRQSSHVQADNQCALWPIWLPRWQGRCPPRNALCSSCILLSSIKLMGSRIIPGWTVSLCIYWIIFLVLSVHVVTNNQTVLQPNCALFVPMPLNIWIERKSEDWRLQFDFIRIKTATHYSQLGRIWSSGRRGSLILLCSSI